MCQRPQCYVCMSHAAVVYPVSSAPHSAVSVTSALFVSLPPPRPGAVSPLAASGPSAATLVPSAVSSVSAAAAPGWEPDGSASVRHASEGDAILQSLGVTQGEDTESRAPTERRAE